jgi:hypothetical protein
VGLRWRGMGIVPKPLNEVVSPHMGRRQSIKRLAAIVLGVASSAFAEDYPRVSMVQLLAAPERYEGRTLWVSGYLHCRFEDSAIYLSREDGDYLRGENAFWVSYAEGARSRVIDRPDTQPVKSSANCGADRKYVSILGRFSPKERGHMGCCAGGIEGVAEILILKRRQ